MTYEQLRRNMANVDDRDLPDQARAWAADEIGMVRAVPGCENLTPVMCGSVEAALALAFEAGRRFGEANSDRRD